ncbi:predicted protein [Postia placenta Mad-698-R]|nr:predicted protein [Postia placenta Mad-698-R]
MTVGGGAKAAGVLHAVGTGTPFDMVRRIQGLCSRARSSAAEVAPALESEITPEATASRAREQGLPPSLFALLRAAIAGVQVAGCSVPASMFRCSVSLESRTESRTWCGNIGLCSGGILNEEYKMVTRVTSSHKFNKQIHLSSRRRRHTDGQQQNYCISIMHACGNSRRFFRPVQSGVGGNDEVSAPGIHLWVFTEFGSMARLRLHARTLTMYADYTSPLRDTHARSLSVLNTCSVCHFPMPSPRVSSRGPREHATLAPVDDVRAISLDGSRNGISPAPPPPLQSQLYHRVVLPDEASRGSLEYSAISADPTCTVAWRAVCDARPGASCKWDGRSTGCCREAIQRTAPSSPVSPGTRCLSYAKISYQVMLTCHNDIDPFSWRHAASPEHDRDTSKRHMVEACTEHETPRRRLRSVVLPDKDSRGEPEDEIVGASCVDGQEAARGVPGTAGQRDLPQARAEEQSRIPHLLWRETASIPPIRRAGRTQTSRVVPASCHHGGMRAGQGASTAGGTPTHCLRRMTRAAGGLVVVFCGTCSVHTNARHRQFTVRARSGDVFVHVPCVRTVI